MPENANTQIISLETFSRLLDCLYRGARDSAPWQGFLAEIKDLLNLQYSTLILRQPTPTDPGLMFTSGGESLNVLDNTENEYSGEFFAQDPLINLPIDRIMTLDDIIPRSELEQNDYYRMFLKPLEIDYITGWDWISSNGSRVSIRFTRTQKQGQFQAQEKAFLELLRPHLTNAVAFCLEQQQLASERQVYAQFISKRSIGIITLDKNGEILQLNTTAEQYIANGDALSRTNNQLLTNSPALNDKLKGFIQDALNAKRNRQRAPINALSVPRTSGLLDYQLMVKPMPSDRHSESESAPQLMIFLQDPEKNLEISVRLLMNLYQLTLSEATIAILLSEGNTMDDVAEELDIKKNTVRAHLRSIFAKTGVTQQSMLVSLVLTSLASTS
ncbi:helix-turn-helix transcriptional regulator [Pseudomaricurvus alkylphenolicus]|jgi:DNA-binding CsgD family transcriptional regulator|uniref:helix-turn-helix transcriptional regulator n=1 Tax=Pseudomaricurvus alkylphenolicus TaxID=1306991 RepID=UPI00141D7D9E|nr:helix-turn-helix transcriptional regulator [Pseudomaricurvus alkylphenolicus]NIB42923.1 helix-turn-helix transcriptional regulator [Pseudomaricurvus alkylphenolicus]